MDLFNLAVFRMAKLKMEWIGQRQTLIAENIANANTPDYTARDLAPLDFKALAEQATAPRVELAATNPGHIQVPLTDGPFDTEKEQHAFQTTLNGNPVTVTDEMDKLSSGRLDYEFALNLVHKNLQLLQKAVDAGGTSA